MATPAPSTFHSGENGVSVLQSRVTILESDNKEKTKKIESLTADLEKLKGLYRKAIRGEEQDSYEALHGRLNEFRQTVGELEKLKGLYKKSTRGEDQDSYDALQARFNEFRQKVADNLKIIEQQILGLEKEGQMFEDNEHEFRLEIASLKESVAEKERQNVHLESVAEGFKKQFEAEEETVAERDATIKQLKDHDDELEKYITKCENEILELKDKVKQLEGDKAHLEVQLAFAKSEVVTANNGKAGTDTIISDLRAANAVYQAKVTNADKETTSLKSKIEAQALVIGALQNVEGELIEARKISTGLREQLDRLHEDALRFDPRPKAHTAPLGADGRPPTLRTLADEVDEVVISFGSGSSHHSGTESEVEVTGKTSIEDSESEAESAKTEIVEVVKNVPGPTIHVYVPYQTFAHNPFLCWFLTEFNFVVLFASWLRWASGRAASSLRRALSTQTPGGPAPNSAQQTSNGGSSQPQNGTNGTAPAGQQPATQPQNGSVASPSPTTSQPAMQSPNGTGSTQPPPATQNGINGSSSPPSSAGNPTGPTQAVFTAPGANAHPQNPPPPSPINPALANVADIIGPVTPVEGNRPRLPHGGNRPAAGNGNIPYGPRVRWWSPYVDPNHPPNARQTLSSMLLHLIFYYFLWVCYDCYKEREIWRAANEASRLLLAEYLALRTRCGRSLASHLFSEAVVSRIDRIILATVSLFKVEIKAYPLPG